MIDFFIIGLGGFLGCCLRFGIGKLIMPLKLEFPLATLICNITAGFLAGFFTQLENDTGIIPPK